MYIILSILSVKQSFNIFFFGGGNFPKAIVPDYRRRFIWNLKFKLK